MRTFTLDTNCILAIDEGRPDAASVHVLADAHASGKTHVAVVAISASEKQKDEAHLENFATFQQRLVALDLAHLEILKPMFYWDITFWDWCIWSSPEMGLLEKNIHEALFPNVEFLWRDYCRARGWNPEQQSLAHRWRNPKCDVQALWSHIFHDRNVFVTADGNYHAVTKKPALIALGAKQIEYPQSAVSLLEETV